MTDKHSPPLTAIDKAGDWCYQFSMNLDYSRESGFAGQRTTFVRLRPWKQEKGAPVMFVGSGPTFETAARAAMENATNGNRKPLNFSWRPWRDGVLGSIDSPAEADLPF